MDFVGDFQKKQKLAEALRRREKALLGAQIDMGPIVTQGGGAFPGMVQANWAAPLAQLGQAYFAGKAGDEAATAEEEAVAARRAGLLGILGMQDPNTPAGVVPPGGDVGPVQPGQAPLTPAGQPGAQAPTGLSETFEMTPDKMLALSDLGVDSGVIQMMKPDKEKFANFLQALPNLSPEAAEMIGARFGLKPGEAGQMATGYQTRMEQARQQAIDDKVEVYNLTRGRGGAGGGGGGGGGGAPAPSGTPGGTATVKGKFDRKIAQANYVKAMADGDKAGMDYWGGVLKDPLLGGKAPSAGGSGSGRKAPPRSVEDIKGRLKEVRKIANGPTGDQIFSGLNRGLRKGLDVASGSENAFVAGIGTAFEAPGTPDARKISTTISDLGLDKISALYPASDRDVKFIMDNLPSVYTSQATFNSVLDAYERVVDHFGAGADQGGGGGTPAEAPKGPPDVKTPKGFERWPPEMQQEWLEAQ